MSNNETDYERLAIKKLQEADLWWNGYQESVSKYRRTLVVHVAYRMFRERAERSRLSSAVIQSLRRGEDTARAILVYTRGEIENLARSAVSCEMASRIYYEEKEGQHWNEQD